jgi:hypothetical protein
VGVNVNNGELKMSQFSNSSASILLYYISLPQTIASLHRQSLQFGFFLPKTVVNKTAACSTGVSSLRVQIDKSGRKQNAAVVLIAGKFYYYASAVMGLLRAHT